MVGTVILKFHPGYQPSRINAAMTEAVSALPGVESVDIYALCPREDDLKAAEDVEVERLYAADRLCVQFPVHWFAATPRALGWQDLVLNRIVFTHPEEGERVKGLPFMISATAGQPEQSYSRGHANMYPLGEPMRPWEVTAKQSGFAWHEPFFAYGTDDYDEGNVDRVARDFAARIAVWAAEASAPRRDGPAAPRGAQPAQWRG